jgi:hypothetical protein
MRYRRKLVPAPKPFTALPSLGMPRPGHFLSLTNRLNLCWAEAGGLNSEAAYLFVLAGGGVGAFVDVVSVLVLVSLLQPVSIMPAAKPNSAIKVYIRFIVAKVYHKGRRDDRVIFPICKRG